jgi:hypothetical protein
MCDDPGDERPVPGGGRRDVHDDGCRCHDCHRTENPEPDDILRGINPDCCGCGAELVVLRGYLAPDGAPEVWRLYLSLSMNEYLSIADRDIVAQKQVGPGSLVWVCSDSPVRHVRARTGRQIQHDLFDGPIVSRRSREGEDGGADGAGGYPVPDPYTSFGCPASVKYTRCH